MAGIPGMRPQAPGPLTSELLAARAAEVRSFHMPGHKGGSGASPLAVEVLGATALASDLSELGGLDYLHAASAGIAESQQVAARLFGAEATHFLVNGATVGNIAALVATTRDDSHALVLRASHRSMYAGLAMGGATPLYVPPGRSDALDGFYGGRLEVARSHVAGHGRSITAVHVTRPNYYGFCMDLAPWAELADECGAALIVDEAHGTHFVFSDQLPATALSLGAHITVQSPHKTLSSLTQSSLLHVRGDRVDRVRLSNALAMLQSSSPSALLMVSLDLTCAQMIAEGPKRWQQVVSLAHDVRAQIDRTAGLHCVGDEILGTGGITQIDPTKIVVDVSALGITGWQAAAVLRSQHGLNPEFADPRRIVCSLTIGDDQATAGLLVDALQQLASTTLDAGSVVTGPVVTGPVVTADRSLVALRPQLAAAQMALTPRQASQATSEAVPLDESVGRTAAEFVIPYPPGIPLIVPGELLERSVLDEAVRLMSEGASIVGTAEPKLSTIRVLTPGNHAVIEGRGYPR